MLRQKLMCDADTNLITYNWIQNHYAPHPNFNVQHKCGNYENLVQHTLAHSIDGSSSPRGWLLRPENEPIVDFRQPPFDPIADV